MEQTVLTFEKLPEAVAYLVTEVNNIRRLLELSLIHIYWLTNAA